MKSNQLKKKKSLDVKAQVKSVGFYCPYKNYHLPNFNEIKLSMKKLQVSKSFNNYTNFWWTFEWSKCESVLSQQKFLSTKAVVKRNVDKPNGQMDCLHN